MHAAYFSYSDAYVVASEMGNFRETTKVWERQGFNNKIERT